MLCRVSPCLIPSCDQAVFPSEVFGCDFEILRLSPEDHCDTGHSCSPSTLDLITSPRPGPKGWLSPRVAQGPWPGSRARGLSVTVLLVSSPEPLHQTHGSWWGEALPHGRGCGASGHF